MGSYVTHQWNPDSFYNAKRYRNLEPVAKIKQLPVSVALTWNITYLRITIQINDKTVLTIKVGKIVRKGFICFCNTFVLTSQLQQNFNCKRSLIRLLLSH